LNFIVFKIPQQNFNKVSTDQQPTAANHFSDYSILVVSRLFRKHLWKSSRVFHGQLLAAQIWVHASRTVALSWASAPTEDLGGTGLGQTLHPQSISALLLADLVPQ